MWPEAEVCQCVSYYFKPTLFGVWGSEQMLQRGQGRDSWGGVLGLCGLHALALLPGHRLEVAEGHQSQPCLVLIRVSALEL